MNKAMIAYKIIFKESAKKSLSGLNKKLADKITLKIYALKEELRPHGVKKLAGNLNYYRIRIGDYRVIYSIHENILTVEIIRIGHRKDVYN
jgi:mRNA interferase RelE/StbE